MSIGLLLLSSNFFITNFAPHTNLMDFFKGFGAGLGIILVLSAFYKKKPRQA
jgi:hypothetical protein